jgi:hypothetical protein
MALEKISRRLTLGFKSPASPRHHGAGSITVWPQRPDCSWSKGHELRLSLGSAKSGLDVGFTLATHAMGHRGAGKAQVADREFRSPALSPTLAEINADGRGRSAAICDFGRTREQSRRLHVLDCLPAVVDRDPPDIAGGGGFRQRHGQNAVLE